MKISDESNPQHSTTYSGAWFGEGSHFNAIARASEPQKHWDNNRSNLRLTINKGVLLPLPQSAAESNRFHQGAMSCHPVRFPLLGVAFLLGVRLFSAGYRCRPSHWRYSLVVLRRADWRPFQRLRQLHCRHRRYV